MSEEKDADEVMQIFREEEKIHCLEGSSGLDGLNKICAAIGYKEQCYREGSSLEEFLKDNSGCCDAIVEWITNHLDSIPDWKEGLSFDDEDEDDDVRDVQGDEDVDNDRAEEADEQATSDLFDAK